jgi:hypothetical protein
MNSKPLTPVTPTLCPVKNEKFSLCTSFFDKVFTLLIPKVLESAPFAGS